MTRTAREVVELYNLVVWNERNFKLADELMGDTVIRHEVGEAHTLTHEQAVRRIVEHWDMFDKLRFDLNLVVAGDDGEHVAIVYQSPMELKDGTTTSVGSMEIFRVVDGQYSKSCWHIISDIGTFFRILRDVNALTPRGRSAPIAMVQAQAPSQSTCHWQQCH